MKSVVDLQNVSYDYLDANQIFRALKNVTLSIKLGEYVAITGASGSGKSTMLNIIGVLAYPTEGTFELCGENTKESDENMRALLRRRHIGFIFQQFNLLPRLTALENILLPTLYIEDLDLKSRNKYHERALFLLSEFGIGHEAYKRPGEMSGGQKQRVAICRALLLDPDIILADEPTGALDANTTREVLAVLDTLHKRGKTVIVITHDPVVAAHSSRKIFLKDGEIVTDSQNKGSAEQKNEENSLLFQSWVSRILCSIYEKMREISYAWKSLLSHKLRSFLTGLGLVIGVASIVFVAGLGLIAQRSFAHLFLSPVTQKVYIFVDNHDSNRKKTYWPGVEPYREFPKIAEKFQRYGVVRPNFNSEPCTFTSGSQSTRTRYQGLYDAQEYGELDTPLASGRFPSDPEIENGSAVAVLGSAAVDALFAKDYAGRGLPNFPIGEKISSSGCDVQQTFSVIGVLQAQDLMFMRTDANDALYIPIPALLAGGAQARFRRGFSVMPKTGVDPRWIADSLANFLSSKEAGRIEFRTLVPAEILEKVQMMLTILQGLTAFIGGLCIVVGGIGIMNIMLVSVRERVREIGLSKSLGAAPWQIRRQFLTESITLCVFSGVLGVLAGFSANNAVAFALARFMPNLGEYEVVVAWTGIVLGLIVSGLCGLTFGIFPAIKAGKVDPAECLRDE